MNKLIFIIIQLVNVSLILIVVKADVLMKFKMLKIIKSTVFNVLNSKTYFFKNNVYLRENIKVRIKPFSIISVGVTILIFIVSKTFIGVTSTSILLSLPILFAYFISSYIKSFITNDRYLKQMPSYVVNIKTQIEMENNIAKAMLNAQVERPLEVPINRFKVNVGSGMEVNNALEILKTHISISKISIFLDSCKICYVKGGNFKKLVEKYLSFITLENEQKEKIKEDAYGAILTLIIMVIINVLVLIVFVFGNIQYKELLINTNTGKLILNFNLLSYYLIIYLIFKIYKGED